MSLALTGLLLLHLSETSYGRTHTYEYDVAGNRTEANLASHGTVLRVITSTYDALNRLVQGRGFSVWI